MDGLDTQIEDLQRKFPKAKFERRADGTALVTIPEFPLPAGWNAPSGEVEVLFVVPVGYPQARPDCFWASAELRLQSGSMPANSGLNTNYGGSAQRLWFSYHAQTWNPNADSLLTYANVISRRLRDAR